MPEPEALRGEIRRALSALRRRRPMLHAITNPVAMALTANGLLACGAASPVMADDPAEAAGMAAVSSAVLVNLGTFHPSTAQAMRSAAETAHGGGRPVVLDPVAAGASRLRLAFAEDLLGRGLVTAVKGNADEVLALGGDPSASLVGYGTEAVDPAAGVDAARALCRRHALVAVRTGPVDYATDGRRAFEVENGTPLLALTTATGCLAGALIAVFLAVEPPGAAAAACALAVLGVAAERAAQVAGGPGSFIPALLDALFALTPEEAADAARIRPGRP